MRRSAAIAISVMFAGSVFVAAAPMALADDGERGGGDHDRCEHAAACPTASIRPGFGFGDQNHEHTGPAGQANGAMNTASPRARANEEANEHAAANRAECYEDENEVEDEVENEVENDVDNDDAACVTPAATPTPTATARTCAPRCRRSSCSPTPARCAR